VYSCRSPTRQAGAGWLRPRLIIKPQRASPARRPGPAALGDPGQACGGLPFREAAGGEANGDESIRTNERTGSVKTQDVGEVSLSERDKETSMTCPHCSSSAIRERRQRTALG
jgi:hypothetical protein